MSDHQYSSDWSDDDVARFVAICRDLECEPLDMLGVMWVESGAKADAKNPHSSATGLIQWMQDSWARWGFTREEFCAIGVSGQLSYLRQWFISKRGQLTSAARIYVAVFLPGLFARSSDPDYVLAASDGPLAWAYRANTFFDRVGNRDGEIQVRELEAAVIAACHGKRWDELSARIKARIEAEGDASACLPSS